MEERMKREAGEEPARVVRFPRPKLSQFTITIIFIPSFLHLLSVYSVFDPDFRGPESTFF